MSINGIGNGGGHTKVADLYSSPPSSRSGDRLQLTQPGIERPREPSLATRVLRGELPLDQYLDACSREATTHLRDKLTTDQLALVHDVLREQFQTDPVLVQLTRRATGQSPEAR